MVVARVLDHFATGGGALLALLGTLLHVLVVSELGAGLAAFIAGFGTGFANGYRKRALPGNDIRRDGADIAAIDTELHRLDMLLFPSRHQFFAMVMARLAFELTVGASLRTIVKMAFVGMIMGVIIGMVVRFRRLLHNLRLSRAVRAEGNRGCAERSE